MRRVNSRQCDVSISQQRPFARTTRRRKEEKRPRKGCLDIIKERNGQAKWLSGELLVLVVLELLELVASVAGGRKGEREQNVTHLLRVTYTNRRTSRAGSQLATCSLLCSHTRVRINLSVSCHVQSSHSMSLAECTRCSHCVPAEGVVQQPTANSQQLKIQGLLCTSQVRVRLFSVSVMLNIAEI
ncbi:hypothetical protein KQX54_010958 [Cotesia glomerata]|uniref:Uncharacterized protein n=1 Tax=Cotesia glomerata TaxID=32391 RepID=A0AAV7J439_COTGL|nr:hypothetical protein KQX54_010958 [Cotesia glomerata]